jgi:hypothetical protein
LPFSEQTIKKGNGVINLFCGRPNGSFPDYYNSTEIYSVLSAIEHRGFRSSIEYDSAVGFYVVSLPIKKKKHNIYHHKIREIAIWKVVVDWIEWHYSTLEKTVILTDQLSNG